MQHGRAVEEGPVNQVFSYPQDGYTRGLVAAARQLELAVRGMR
jgi:ABC-type microcin C transport system duplicated ATPase subunit YejF